MIESDILKAFLGWALIFPALFLLGSWFRFLIPFENLILRGVWCCAIGMALASYGIVLLSAIHLLNSLSIAICFLAVIVVRRHWLQEWVRWVKALIESISKGSSWSSKLLAVYFLFLRF